MTAVMRAERGGSHYECVVLKTGIFLLGYWRLRLIRLVLPLKSYTKVSVFTLKSQIMAGRFAENAR